MPLDLDALKGPAAAGNKPVQGKYTLSTTTRDRLRAASEYAGQDMSTILEMLIMRELVLPGEQAEETPTQQQTVKQEIDFDFPS